MAVLRQAPDGTAALWARSASRLVKRWQFPRQGVEAPQATRRARRPAATLAVREVTVTFGGVTALDQVSFEVTPGEVVGLIGPNGAGKTTLLDVVTGFTSSRSGSVTFDGTPIDGWSVERRARAGIVRSWQAVELFEEMTVRGTGGSITVAGTQSREGAIVDRIAAYTTSTGGKAPPAAAARLHDARAAGFNVLLAEHRRAWAQRWEDADARLDGAPSLQRAVRLALYHLMGSVADHGEAALRILDGGDPVDLLFSDVVMPGGMTGDEVARAARALRPGLKVLLTSGFAKASMQTGPRSDDFKHLLAKPYRKTDLAAKLRAVLDEDS